VEIPIDRSIPHHTEEDMRQMRIAMRWSLGIGLFMLIIKTYAYFITGSAAILSDAMESIVHIFAVCFAAFSLRLIMKPADNEHMYGHDRIAFFSAGFEGAMIIIAALFIIFESIRKWIIGIELEQLGAGTIFTCIATVVNAVLGFYLVRRGKKYESLVLVANGKHVLTDSWTSLGVIAGLVLILFTGWLPFDPILAIVVALNILWTGGKLIRQSIGGLMDESDAKDDVSIREVLERESKKYNIVFHGLRHRNAGNKLVIEFHLLFPENLPLVQAHEQATLIEQELHRSFARQTDILSHLEPIEGHDEFHIKHLHVDKKQIPPTH
jgi:cation diffusion facilitator family transporter